MKANIGSILVNFGVCGATCGGIVAHALASPSRLATWWFLLLLAAGNGIACWRFYESINARPASRELVGGAWAVGAAMSLLVIWRRQWTGVETHVLLSMSMTCLVVGIVCFAAAGLKLKAGRP